MVAIWPERDWVRPKGPGLAPPVMFTVLERGKEREIKREKIQKDR